MIQPQASNIARNVVRRATAVPRRHAVMALAALLAKLSLAGCTTQMPALASAARTAPEHCRLEQAIREQTTQTPVSPESELALALSGGGYRAMLFHVGALWRLQELGLLKQVTVVSSVSGGSIVAGTLAVQTPRLLNEKPGSTACYQALVAQPLMDIARTSLDWKAALSGLFSFRSAGNVLSDYYAERLFGPTLLTDLPAHPTFLFQASNLHTGSVWTFTRTSVGDAQMGAAETGDISVASAVAASSSFPPVLSPYRLQANKLTWKPADAMDEEAKNGREYRSLTSSASEIREPDLRLTARLSDSEIDRIRKHEILLTDGGVADNLGIDALWRSRRSLLISDGGAPNPAMEEPPANWLGQFTRVISIIHQQPAQFRERDVIDEFREVLKGRKRDGAFWSLSRSLPEHREFQNNACRAALTGRLKQLISTPTRLQALDESTAKGLVNLGYNYADWTLPYLDRLMVPTASHGIHEISCKLPFPEVPLW